MHHDDARLQPRAGREVARPDGFQPIDLPGGGKLQYGAGFIEPGLAEHLHQAIRDAVPWTLNVVREHRSRSHSVWEERLSAYARRARRTPDRSLELAQEILRLTGRGVFHGGPAGFDAMGFHRLDAGRDSLTFEGRMLLATGRGGPAALLTFGATRHATFQHRCSQRQVLVPVSHGDLLGIDDSLHAEWTISIKRAPSDRGPHLCLALYGGAPDPARRIHP